jgi:flagellar motor switch protein FliG
MTPPLEKLTISGARKAAILLTVLGEDSAATVFRNLNENDLQRVADEVASLGTVPVELSLQVFEEYQRLTEDMTWHGVSWLRLSGKTTLRASCSG